jgi:hypothetical protein
MNAVDAFGGKEALARTIFNLISDSQGPSKALFVDTNPVEGMAKISRSELLDWMFSEGICLKDAMTLKWTDEQRAQWLTEMRRRGSGEAIALDGAVLGAEQTLGLLVRLEALDELCAPPRRLPEQDLEKIQTLRVKYRKLLAAT